MTAKKPAKNKIEPVASITRLNASHRASQGWQLRVQGYTWDAIARATGYHDGATAYRAVRNYFGAVPAVDHEMQRQIARERTEYLQRKAMEQVEVAPSPANIRAAVDTLRRAAALDGLDAAFKITTEPGVGEVHEWARALLALAGADLPQEADIFAESDVMSSIDRESTTADE